MSGRTKWNDTRRRRFRVLKPPHRPGGLSYPPHKEAVPGDIVSDLPAISIPWLLRRGYIEPVNDEPEEEGA